MPWSIFSDGGGNGAAKTWAQDLLHALGAPDTTADEQFVYDWEVSEGGGGKYNPLNQGPVPGHPELTTTGSQYGGGAADFANWQAGITGAVDYINMPNYTAVKQALLAGNAAGARSALIASPWASSHYGYGSAFSNAALPGQASALAPDGGGVSSATGVSNATGASSSGCAGACSLLFGQMKTDCLNTCEGGGGLGGVGGIFNPFQWLMGVFGISDFKDLVERGGLIILGALFVLIGVVRFTEVGSKVNPVKQVVKAQRAGAREASKTADEVSS